MGGERGDTAGHLARVFGEKISGGGEYADDVAAQREESFEKGRDEGLRLGEEKGLRLGEEKGLRLGEEKGRDEGRVETIRLMMGNMNLTFAQVMDALKIEPSERDRLASLLS